MKKVIALTLVSLVFVGCASKSDIVQLQTQIDTLRPQVEQANHTAQEAKYAAERALNASERTAQLVMKMNDKLDRAFARSLMK